MLAGSELVCFRGQTGNARHTVGTTRLTRLGHGLVDPLVPSQLFRPGFTDKMRSSLIVLVGLWPGLDRGVRHGHRCRLATTRRLHIRLYTVWLSLKDFQMTVTLGSRTERFQVGKALRRKTPRESLADLKGSMSRNAVAILAESDPDRIPELVPERYARMTVNPFAFLRGAAAVMATDLAAQPMTGIPVQAGGDSHLMNLD